MRLTRVDDVAQDARHTTGEWLTWALDAVDNPRAEFETVIREMVGEKIKATREGAGELLRDIAGDTDEEPSGPDWDPTDRSA